jgi:anti-anti-sigma factor
MQIQDIISGDRHEFLVLGRIDGEGANQLEVGILAAIRAGAREILVNLSGSDFICSAGIRVLLQYYRKMKGEQKTLLATRPSPNIEAILEMTGFKHLIVEGAKPAP